MILYLIDYWDNDGDVFEIFADENRIYSENFVNKYEKDFIGGIGGD